MSVSLCKYEIHWRIVQKYKGTCRIAIIDGWMQVRLLHLYIIVCGYILLTLQRFLASRSWRPDIIRPINLLRF